MAFSAEGELPEKEKGPMSEDIGPTKNTRQRPTLPRSCPRSTIGGRRLNYRVRNGNGCDPSPMTTGNMNQPTPNTGAARCAVCPGGPGMFSGARADAHRRLKLKKSEKPRQLPPGPAEAFRDSWLRRVRHSRGSGDGEEYPAEGSSRREHARAVEKVMMKPHG